MKTSPVTSLPAPLNLVADSPCMLALMSGFDHFQVDFFLVGDVAGYHRFLAKESQSESNVLPEGQQLSPLKATDWAIFISDGVPYADLKVWLVKHAGFTSDKQDNEFYLRYDYHGCDAAVKVALLPFAELQNQNNHWVPTGFGMARDPNEFDFDPELGNFELQLPSYHSGRAGWLPMTLPEIMATKLLSFSPEPIQGSNRAAHDVCSLIENYKLLEHDHVFLFHRDAYLGTKGAVGYSELDLHKCYAEILGRQMSFLLQSKGEFELLGMTLNNEVHPAEDYSIPLSETIALIMSRPRYYGDLMVLSYEHCLQLLLAMGRGYTEDCYL